MPIQPQPGSKPYRDQLRARLIGLGFADRLLVEHLAQDLLHRCAKRPREAWRLASELSLDEAATRFNAVVRDPRAPMKKGRIWDYEQWPHSGVRPTVRALKVLAQVYGTSWERLVDIDDLAHMPEEDREAYHAVLALHRTAVAGANLGALAIPAADHRVVVTPSQEFDAPPELVIAEAAEESAALAAWAGTTNVDDDVLEQLDRSLRAVAHAYIYSSPYPLLLRARRLRSRVRKLLLGQQRPAQTRELYLIGARACTLLAWMTGDLGNYAAAGDHSWAGWMCAQHADHDGARTWVRVTQSKLAFWDGDFVESARLAQDGLRYAPADSAAVMLALLEARAWARIGRVDDARAALARWQQERERVPGPDLVGGVLGVSDAQQHYLAGSTHLWLRQPADALEETTRSIALFEETPVEQRFYGAEMLARVDAGRAHLLNGELDGAIAAVNPVLALDPDQRLETFVQNLGYLRTSLAGPNFRGSSLAQQTQERIEEYCATAVSRELDLRR